ncbi:Transposon Ty3-I Gag-Pol polyprotein [Nosema granulosis]|uniref:Transposon Ty3-I Gag-Pol polyprotein n=1 Tax=Nosema granulosis TaxID=83296 RepID=A0A9P6GXR6_9MICR|nr:Transposon Ty3-I Gag-Pol polyprotein [Nosema granulosis]
MPFGLMNASFTFQRIIHKYFAEYLYKFVMVYQDDILIYSSDHNTHLQHLTVVLEIIKRVDFKLNESKCRFGQTKIEFLGFEVENGKMHIPLQQKLKGMDWRLPASKTDV